jgi:hypothetical protein
MIVTFNNVPVRIDPLLLSIMKHAEDEGVELKIIEFPLSRDHRDPFWYSSTVSGHYTSVATAKYLGRTASLEAVGEIKLIDHGIETQDDSIPERVIYGPNDVDPLEFIKGDPAFKDQDRFEWYNNNWFEIFYLRPGEITWDSIASEPMYDIFEGINQIIDDVLNDDWWNEK